MKLAGHVGRIFHQETGSLCSEVQMTPLIHPKVSLHAYAQ